jgi:ATP-dependent protease HslVU (ClpYQ) peptidase subunit
MTCVVGLETKEGVLIGADAAAVNQATLELDRVVAPKVWRYEDEPIIVGYTASFRFGQILQYHLEVSQPPTEKEDLMAWVVTDFIGAARQALRQGGWLKIEGDREQTGEMLVGVRQCLFYVGCEWEVVRASRGYNAVGCGGDYAKGSLYATIANGYPPEKRIREALCSAAEHSAGVVPPFTTLRNFGQ